MADNKIGTSADLSMLDQLREPVKSRNELMYDEAVEAAKRGELSIFEVAPKPASDLEEGAAQKMLETTRGKMLHGLRVYLSKPGIPVKLQATKHKDADKIIVWQPQVTSDAPGEDATEKAA